MCQWKNPNLEERIWVSKTSVLRSTSRVEKLAFPMGDHSTAPPCSPRVLCSRHILEQLDLFSLQERLSSLQLLTKHSHNELLDHQACQMSSYFLKVPWIYSSISSNLLKAWNQACHGEKASSCAFFFFLIWRPPKWHSWVELLCPVPVPSLRPCDKCFPDSWARESLFHQLVCAVSRDDGQCVSSCVSCFSLIPKMLCMFAVDFLRLTFQAAIHPLRPSLTLCHLRCVVRLVVHDSLHQSPLWRGDETATHNNFPLVS